MIDEKIMYVQDEYGDEVKMEILFTFDLNGKNYVCFKRADNFDDEIYASCYDDSGLLPIETEAEWEIVEEVLGSFMEEAENGNI